MEKIKSYIRRFGLPRIIIFLLFLFVCLAAVILHQPVDILASNVIVRFGMFGILVLAMVPSIQSGTGPNFALPIGIVSGLLGSLIAIELRPANHLWGTFLAALFISIPFAVVSGWIYGMLLNKIKGSEMLVATYTGFSIVSVMQIGWIQFPFKDREMVWPIGKGLRMTVALDSTFRQVLDKFWQFEIWGVSIPTGMLLFFIGCCLLVWIFTRSKTGIALRAAGDNPKFALASGISVDKNRILGTILSTVLGAIGIVVYSQSFGFLQLYTAPLTAAFPAVAAILIGGASTKRASISNVIVGVFLFQGLLTVALPVANQVFPHGNLSEVLRLIVQNGIILYALTKAGGQT
jgi:simple sugar transport system permease protein